MTDLYGNSFRPASLLSLILSLGEAESCWPPPRVLQTLTSCRYSPSLAAVCLCRESTYVFGPSRRRSASATKTHAGYDKPTAGHKKFCRAKSCSSAGPPASPPSIGLKFAAKIKWSPSGWVTWSNAHSRQVCPAKSCSSAAPLASPPSLG